MSGRLSTKWKKRAFQRIGLRDGFRCGRCGCVHRVVWRAMGQWSGAQWGDDPWERAIYTKVISTSNLELDHKVRLIDGGSNADDNLWLLCSDCHKSKTSAEQSAHLKRLFAEAKPCQG